MFKLTLRELFLLVTLAAVLVAWRLDRLGLTESVTDAETKQAAAESKQVAAETATLEIADRYMRVWYAVRKRGMYVDIDKSTGKYPKVAIIGNSTPDLEVSGQMP